MARSGALLLFRFREGVRRKWTVDSWLGLDDRVHISDPGAETILYRWIDDARRQLLRGVPANSNDLRPRPAGQRSVPRPGRVSTKPTSTCAVSGGISTAPSISMGRQSISCSRPPGEAVSVVSQRVELVATIARALPSPSFSPAALASRRTSGPHATSWMPRGLPVTVSARMRRASETAVATTRHDTCELPFGALASGRSHVNRKPV